MVTRKNLKSNALISVYDKSSLKQLCATLDRHNIGIISTGGTGLGPRDLTIETLEGSFNSSLPGIEQALHAYGRNKVKTSILSRLKAGLIGKTIVICIPGSPGAAKDTLNVLIPTIFHSFHMMMGEKH